MPNGHRIDVIFTSCARWADINVLLYDLRSWYESIQYSNQKDPTIYIYIETNMVALKILQDETG